MFQKSCVTLTLLRIRVTFFDFIFRLGFLVLLNTCRVGESKTNNYGPAPDNKRITQGKITHRAKVNKRSYVTLSFPKLISQTYGKIIKWF